MKKDAEILRSGGLQCLEVLVEAAYLYDFPIVKLLKNCPEVVELLRRSLRTDVAVMDEIYVDHVTAIMKRKNAILLEITGEGEL